MLYFADAPVLHDAEPQQVEYLAWYRREQWRKNEERRMALLIETAFEGQNDERTRMWKTWCLRFLCKRFHDMTRWEWIPAMAKLDEDWLWHGDKDCKAFGYLRRIRYMAIRFVEENHLEDRRGVDI
jgi:hypothetical protein